MGNETKLNMNKLCARARTHRYKADESFKSQTCLRDSQGTNHFAEEKIKFFAL